MMIWIAVIETNLQVLVIFQECLSEVDVQRISWVYIPVEAVSDMDALSEMESIYLRKFRCCSTFCNPLPSLLSGESFTSPELNRDKYQLHRHRQLIGRGLLC